MRERPEDSRPEDSFGDSCPTRAIGLCMRADSDTFDAARMLRSRTTRSIDAAYLALAAGSGTLRRMLDVSSHRGCIGRFAPRLPIFSVPLRIGLGCASMLALLWWPSARAGSLYHCTGVHGEAVFSSSTAGYRGCRKIATFAAAPPLAHSKTAALPTSLGRVGGSVTTSARSMPENGADPVSLDRVTAGIATGSHRDATMTAQRTSLVGVQGAVETSAKLLLAAVPSSALAAVVAIQPGYHESSQALAPQFEVDKNGNRVRRGSTYRVVRSDGVVEYTNVPPARLKGNTVTMLFSYTEIETCMACNLHSPIHWGSTALNLTAYADLIRAASIEYGVDEAFLRAIIHAESAFNPRALSLKGAQGLMQLMPGTASDMGVLDAFDTTQNIRGGTRYLGLLLHDFNGNEQFAAAAYNAGPGAVVRYNGVPPYAETQVYVERVGTLRKRYSAAIHPPLTSSNGPG